MEKKFIQFILIIGAILSLLYLVFIFLRYYNSPKNIEEKRTFWFQKGVKNRVWESYEEWALNIDIANDNYLRSMKIS